jgi:hypothetical protein
VNEVYKNEEPKTEGPVFSGIKDRAVFVGWIGGLVLIGGIIWFLTQPVWTSFLMRSVNRVLSLEGDQRRLNARLLIPRPSGSVGPLGSWYTMVNSKDTFFVFTIMRDGVLVLCGAQVSPEGIVTAIVPLSDHAKQVLPDIPQGIIQTYIRRIEALGAGAEGKNNE